MIIKNKYRTHSCEDLSEKNNQDAVTLSGWVSSKRSHGGIVFIDLRDNYGIIQIVFEEENCKNYKEIDKLHTESVITVSGIVRMRDEAMFNLNINTGKIEIVANDCNILSYSNICPFNIHDNLDFSSDLSLSYRFLALRNNKLHQNIILRGKVIKYIRDSMIDMGFYEMHTPILTSSSPEGARDFVVPSRKHKGKFYALPQAPQQFKQLLMVAGFDKYFQIAPCFRDEDPRADRSPGEFYQLDVEMSFVEQEDVLSTIEPLMKDIFVKFGSKKLRASDMIKFERISYNESMLRYGSDKPDLRNPIINYDLTKCFIGSDFKIFSNAIKNGSFVRGIAVKNLNLQSRSFFDNMLSFAQSKGMLGLGYILFDENNKASGPIAKFLDETRLNEIQSICNLGKNDGVFFVCNDKTNVDKLSGYIRAELGNRLKLIDHNVYAFCWIVDFPYFELNSETNKIDFMHNPFSKPQIDKNIDINELSQDELLNINANQYDLVCNGYELCSGGVRNVNLDLLYKVFKICGYSKEIVDEKFSCFVKAFQYGVPPHGGLAPGIERILMLLIGTDNIRDVIAFPLNGSGHDLLMNAPSDIPQSHMRELGIAIK